MHAIGNFILKNNPDLKVLYIPSVDFTNKFINALKQNKTHLFRKKFHNIDVLLIDDIQFLKDKEQTQEVFFHTFNSLHSSGKQVVISSDKPPKELSSFEDRLRNRMEWGLHADIQPPRYETRLAILNQLNEKKNGNINNDILEFISENFKKDIRELEGAFNKVLMYSNIFENVSLNECKKNLFKDLYDETSKIIKNVSINLIIKEVSHYMKIDVESILSNKRDQQITLARQISMYLCKEISDYPYKFIGKHFGKDHSTVMHSYKKIQTKIEEDNSLLNIINNIKKNIINLLD